MCIPRTPKIPDPPPPPAAPPPPTAVAKVVENKGLRNRNKPTRRRGVSALTIRRPVVNVGSTNSGANIY